MPEYNSKQLADIVRNYYQNKTAKPPADFAMPKKYETTGDEISAMPNSDKLTESERWIYGKLPGVSKWMENNKIMGGTISEQLDKFSNSWLGKGLNFLDVAAEGLERTLGTAGAIMRGGDDFDWSSENLKAVWYGSSLLWDTTNMPQFKRNENGTIVGVKIPEDLPGFDGVLEAQVKIKHLMEQGVDPKKALAQVRDEYYGGLGALALRATLNDTWGHVLGDPLNLLTAYVKPIELLKVRRFSALTTKLAGGVDEVVAAADKAADLIRTANPEDIGRLADEAFELANMAGDTKRATQYATQAAEAARKAGRVDDAARYEREAARLAGMTAEEAASYSDEALKAIGKKQLTTGDKIAIMLTGGDPFRPSKVGQLAEKIPIVGGIAKTFRLTPESKAREILTLVSDNIGTNVIARVMSSPNAEADFVSYLRRVSKGANGVEYGHAAMTLEGRTVQSFTKGATSGVERMYGTYQALARERETLKVLADALGESPTKLLRLMDETPEVLADMVLKKQGTSPVLDVLYQSGELAPDKMRALGKTLKDVPYNKEMFFAAALDAIETQAMRQSVVQFGVKSKGALTRWSDALKAAEGLAFLRLNPGYPIRNKLNNDFTMLARGLFGVMPDSAVDSFWEGFGRVPKRLGEGMNAALETQAKGALSEADRILDDALRGGYYSTPDKAKEFFQKLNLGKLDTAKHWGQKIENRASRKAFTLGTQQFLRKYFRPKGIKSYVTRPGLLDELEQVSPDFARHFDNALRASGAMEAKFDSLMNTRLDLNIDSIIDDVGESLGMEVRDVLGDELLEHVHQNLPKALTENSLEAFKVQTRKMVEDHIEDLFNKQVENLVEHVKAQTVAGGHNTWAKKLGEAQDIFWGAHIEHSVRMPEATRLAREASASGDYAAARALWRAEAADAQRYYSRAFRRVDAYIKGLAEGFDELGARGAQMPFKEVRATFDEWQTGWKNFFDEKNRLMDEFWDEVDSTPKGTRTSRSLDDVRAQIKSMYDSQAAKEDELMRRIDDTIAETIEDPTARQAYLNARDTLAEMRTADKKAINEMYETTASMAPEDRQAAWNDFWAQRQKRYQNMRSVEQASLAIGQGDPNATMMFGQARKAEKEKKGDKVLGVFNMAEEYGIPTSTKKGARNDRRILNTVNKYSGARVDMTNKAVNVPRHELPAPVSERMADWARQLKRDLGEGEPGQRVRKAAEFRQPGDAPIRIGSTNPDWYTELYSKGLRKPAIDKALDKIIQDQGADKGATVERVKQIIIENLRYGDPNHGVPPDLYVLSEMGASKKVLQEALDDYNDILKTELSLEEALLQSMPDDVRAGVSYDAAGNLQMPGRYTNVEDIPEDVARSAFEARAQAKGLEAPAQEPEVTPEFIAEVNKVIPTQPPLDLGMDMMTYGRSYSALDAVIDGAATAAQKTPTTLTDLPAHLQDEVRRAVKLAKNDMASTRYQALKFGEWRRDSALLNYNRRTNFDNYLGHVAPFAFWSTSSMMQWALESIDRPAMITNYLRTKKLFATAGLERDGQASRTKGKIRVQLPFAPDWMGEQFIDPLRILLPFDNWASPFEQLQQQSQSQAGRTERLLQQQVADGEITQEEYQQAIETKSGGTWDYAETMTAGNDNSDNFDAFDFATTLATPHAPLMWAYNAAMGNKDEIGSFTPMSRLARNAATMLGVEDWNNSKYNVEAKIRRQMGLPAFDKWDDYRIDRSLSNLAGSGEYTVDDVKEALALSAMVQQGKIDPEAAKEASAAYKEAVKRSNQEYTGGVAGGLLATFGISVTTVPEGESELRKLQDDFGRAYESYKAADQSLDKFLEDHPELEQEQAEDVWTQRNPKLASAVDDLTEFFDKHPEYETRLGLFDPPEARLHKFMIDEVWNKYNSMPKLSKGELADQLPGFEESFLNRSTRSYDDVPVELMQMWMKMMGTDPVGGMTADQKLLTKLYGKMQLTDPETAWRVQTFYDSRDAQHNGWKEAQEEYYKIPKGAGRKAFLRQHPELKGYWDFRNEFMNNNPDLVPYLTDNEEAIADAKNRARTEAAVPTAKELQQVTAMLPPDVKELVYDYASTGEALPPVVINELYDFASSQGLDPQQLVNILGAGVAQ